MREKIVLFGAGATGRGHVGLLAWQAGFEIVFVDKNPALVAALRDGGGYRVRLYGEGVRDIQVSGYRVYHASQRREIAGEIVDAALVLTAVFDGNLPDVAETLALAVSACRTAGRTTPLNCIACENMMDSSSSLGRHILLHLEQDDLNYCREVFGFPDCMISRVVPQPVESPLELITEDYNEWTARRETFKGEKPAALAALELVDNQTARLERKLFIHNGGHAICGYLGYPRGATYIHEALRDAAVVTGVSGALDELGEVVRCKHGFSAESIEAYKADLARRGAIAELKDQARRVTRDPLRKLSPNERLVAPAREAERLNLPRHWIVNGIVSALKYNNPEDSESRALQARIAAEGVAAVLERVCGIQAGTALAEEIQAAWDHWKIG